MLYANHETQLKGSIVNIFFETDVVIQIFIIYAGVDDDTTMIQSNKLNFVVFYRVWTICNLVTIFKKKKKNSKKFKNSLNIILYIFVL